MTTTTTTSSTHTDAEVSPVRTRPLGAEHFETLDRLMRDTPYRPDFPERIIAEILAEPMYQQRFRGCSRDDVREYVGSNFQRWVQLADDDPLSIDLFLWAGAWESEFLVPGLFEWPSRILVTGEIGAGKSTLLAQMAVRMASGLHPFADAEEYRPLRVLLVETENLGHELHRRLLHLTNLAGDRLDRSALFVHRPEGSFHLDDDDDFDWLRSKIQSTGAQVLVLGSLYKAYSPGGDRKDEHTALAITERLDRLVDEDLCSLIIEAHTNKGGKDTRPADSAVWSKWPEYGLHLSRSGRLSEFRPARGQGKWPRQLHRGGEWPWMADARSCETTPAETGDPVDALGEFFATRPGAEFARTQLPSAARAEGIRGRNSAILAALDALESSGSVSVRNAGRSRYYSFASDPAHPAGESAEK